MRGYAWFRGQALVELLLLSAVTAWFVWNGTTELLPDERVSQLILVTLAFWGAVQWASQFATPLSAVLEGSGCVGLMESLIVYAGAEPLQLRDIGFICLAGSILILMVLLPLILRQRNAKTLLVGYERLGRSLVRSLGSKLLGVLAPQPALPAGVPFLDLQRADLDHVMDPVTQIVVDTPDWKRLIPPAKLLDYKLRGMEVESSLEASRQLWNSVDVESLQSARVLWTGAFQPDVRMLVLQAVYSNLLGLALFLLAAPLLLVLGVASWAAAGRPGKIFERVECAGFQGIPFMLQRFRTRHGSTGQSTSVGRLIDSLGLTDLPQLINVVRGEMGLFGPKAVRMEFSLHLETLAIIYSMRLSTRPGIWGWAQANALQDISGAPEEHESLGYDLYYLNHVSPVMDLDIVISSLGRWFRRR